MQLLFCTFHRCFSDLVLNKNCELLQLSSHVIHVLFQLSIHLVVGGIKFLVDENFHGLWKTFPVFVSFVFFGINENNGVYSFVCGLAFFWEEIHEDVILIVEALFHLIGIDNSAVHYALIDLWNQSDYEVQEDDQEEDLSHEPLEVNDVDDYLI